MREPEVCKGLKFKSLRSEESELRRVRGRKNLRIRAHVVEVRGWKSLNFEESQIERALGFQEFEAVRVRF